MDVERRARRQQGGKHVKRPVDRIDRREVVEDLRLEHVDPAVAEVRLRVDRLGLLLEAGDLAVVVVDHDPVLPRVDHPLDRERRDRPGLAVGLCQRVEVDVSQRVARDHEERLLPEEVSAVAHAPGRPEQLLLEAVGHPVAEVPADRLREVVEVGDHLVDPVTREQVDDVGHHRPVEHRDHRLRQLVGQRPQASSQAGR